MQETEDDRRRTMSHPRKRAKLHHVRVPGPALVRSAYHGFQTPAPHVDESSALLALRTAYDSAWSGAQERPEHRFILLDDFSVYHPHGSRRQLELCGLDKLKCKDGLNELAFDGVLSFGGQKYYVEGVNFSVLTVDGYADDQAVDMGDQLCVQSQLASKVDVWYQLGKPAASYQEVYRPFLWLALFTKHFIDYLIEHENVTIRDFKDHFFNWLSNRFGADPRFIEWHSQAQLKDFRTTVVAHIIYIKKECWSIDNEDWHLLKHPVWSEINHFQLNAIPVQASKEQRTVVTPYTYYCFRKMYFREHMVWKEPNGDSITASLDRRKRELCLTPLLRAEDLDRLENLSKAKAPLSSMLIDRPVRAEDVVCLAAEKVGEWKKSTESYWFAYVQGVRPVQDGAALDILWLYSPSDTIIGGMNHPFPNELFLSDNCGCGSKAYPSSEVLGILPVKWFADDPTTECGYFVRQKYWTSHEEEDFNFTTLKAGDFTCDCSKPQSRVGEIIAKYPVGSTVLYRPDPQAYRGGRTDVLQLGQVVAIEVDHSLITVRKMTRKALLDHRAAPNELLLSDEFAAVLPARIAGDFKLQFFAPHDFEHGRAPAPYGSDGTGHYFYVVTPGGRPPSGGPDFILGMDPRTHRNIDSLRGMGIFCGGGNFDRGLAEGGAVDFKYAVDWDRHALHSYRANVERPDKMHFFLGSVNDYLARAMKGSSNPAIARIGDFTILAAGSPCPGFSRLQQDRYSHQSLRNASMVASVVAFVDFYNPEYLILENVPAMADSFGPNRNQSVLGQVIAALVGLGYQTQQFLADACTQGSPQRRSRLFIVATAPGLEPFAHLGHTHSHPRDRKIFHSGLGRSTNGQIFGKRSLEYTVFPHVSIQQATKDLPVIDFGQVRVCPAHPNHYLPAEQGATMRSCLTQIPTNPPGMGLVEAERGGYLSGIALEYAQSRNEAQRRVGSGCYLRIRPDGLLPTITTTTRLTDARGAGSIHWTEPRPLTILELRRGQGFLDHEVIVGSALDQCRVIGNSVDRKLALALGLALRDAVQKNTNQTMSPTGLRTAPSKSGRKGYVLLQHRPRFSEGNFDMTVKYQSVQLDMARAGTIEATQKTMYLTIHS